MFRTTARRQVEATEVAASARQFKNQVKRELEILFASLLRDGETLPDLDFLQELIGRLLDINGNRVVSIDTAHTSLLVSAAALRARRNELSLKLRQRMSDARYLLERSVDDGVYKAALRDRRLSKLKPVLLVQGARDVVLALRDPTLTLGGGDAALLAAAVNFAQALEADANELEQVISLLSPQKKANQDSLGAKVADLRDAAETNRRCAELLFGLYRLARLDYHAERVRARLRRRVAAEVEMPAPPPETMEMSVVVN